MLLKFYIFYIIFGCYTFVNGGHYDTIKMDEMENYAYLHNPNSVQKNWRDTLYFKSKDSNGESFANFLVVGDWGGLPTKPYTTGIEVSVAKQMSLLARKHLPKFILTLGDNFYTDGVKNVNDPRFRETYEDVYNDTSLQIPWYLVAGNHDYYGNITAQIAYTKVSKRWNFPDKFYSLNFTFNGGKTRVAVIMIDTIVLCGIACDYHRPFHHFHNRHRKRMSVKSWSWMEDQMKKYSEAGVDYIFVGGHFPCYSIAEHGPCPCMYKKMPALMAKYKVTAYLSGHEHNLQHLQVDSQNYFVIGAGNYNCASTAHKWVVPQNSLRFHWANLKGFGGFAMFNVGDKNITVNYYNGLGEKLYNYTLLPRS